MFLCTVRGNSVGHCEKLQQSESCKGSSSQPKESENRRSGWRPLAHMAGKCGGEGPQKYDWSGYLAVVKMVNAAGLKLQASLCFHGSSILIISSLVLKVKTQKC
ncbi:hypothetical protein MPTK1_6g10190 [Marchantia polymorpha subsp. ruderalis]|uniref:Beta-amylase n=2 Tax=Marchantia polymorpha TaxID=3197 RepID=A0AAF6BQH9_MARPO|nr:hypothetical protein MARPO_0016s0062 [Marchantia polymorpha]BBN14263.1 hypothetical protein Mp_6g10190 [Marchantia polymorpha subsp. ruderalis]|eukprot:PTQ44998.1 hypothetical protein MARPO_0016s0062 [Marchantia polymorpha]